jgi:glyoxylase-like metal-dependent hydrolase (beta-lactamase superfamily II)
LQTTLRPGLDRVLAPNPSPMTESGTNSYVLGERTLCIIDPGPDMEPHRAALMAAIDGRKVSHIIVTHSHLDHSALAPRLSDTVGAPVLAYGPAGSGRSAVMKRLAASGLRSGGEGIDTAFQPDATLSCGEVIAGDGWQLRVIHTPGHLGNHICLRWEDALFTGDHAMGWASTLVSPPDGDLTDFMASCERLLAEGSTSLYPGHGAVVTDGPARLRALVAHRLQRESQILAHLDKGPQTPQRLTEQIYTDIPSALLPAAQRNILAHLIDLQERNLVTANPAPSESARFQRT